MMEYHHELAREFTWLYVKIIIRFDRKKFHLLFKETGEDSSIIWRNIRSCGLFSNDTDGYLLPDEIIHPAYTDRINRSNN